MPPARSFALGGVPVLLLVLLAARAATERIADADLGWIVAAGERILDARAVPVTNGLSFVAPDHPWIMHEWLLGAVYALGWRALGPPVFSVVALLLTLGLGALVLHRSSVTLPRGVSALWAGALLVFAFDRQTSARPIGVAILLACAVVVLAFRPATRPSRAPHVPRGSLVACVALELVWTNVHGSFPLGVVILACAAVDARDAGSEARGRRAALACAAAVTLLNPRGLALHRLVLSYALGTDGAIREVHHRVLEFAPIWRAGYHDVVGPIEVLLLGLLLAAGGLALRARGHRGAGLLAVILVASALLQARNVPLALIAASLALQPCVATLFSPDRDRASSEACSASVMLRATRHASLGVAPAAITGLAALVLTARTRAADDWIDPSIGGASFARLARKLPDGARAFVPFRSGGLLLLLGAERGVRTFYDARNDCYPSEVAAVALALKDGELPADGLAPLLERWGTRWAIVPRAAHVRGARGDPRWAALAVLEPALASDFHEEAEDGGWLLLRR